MRICVFVSNLNFKIKFYKIMHMQVKMKRIYLKYVRGVYKHAKE